MRVRRRAAWSELDFERWFEANPVLPGGERLLVVAGHEPIRRMVDITALDSDGGIVVLEVKNEKAHRTAVGQALEYLSHLEGVTREDLEDDFADYRERSLGEEFRNLFGIPLPPVSGRRRVFLVAPAHDSYAAVCASYLSKCFAQLDVRFSLIVASPSGEGFRLSEPEYLPFKRPTAMPASFGTSPGGRLFFVLDAANPPIVWSIGKWRVDGPSLTVSTGPSLTALRPHRRLLLPLDHPPHVDLAIAGSRWRHRSKTGRQAIIIGSIRPGRLENLGATTVVFAQFRNGAFQTFRRRPEGELHEDWVQITADPPQWREIAVAAKTEVARRRAVTQNRRTSTKVVAGLTRRNAPCDQPTTS